MLAAGRQLGTSASRRMAPRRLPMCRRMPACGLVRSTTPQPWQVRILSRCLDTLFSIYKMAHAMPSVTECTDNFDGWQSTVDHARCCSSRPVVSSDELYSASSEQQDQYPHALDQT